MFLRQSTDLIWYIVHAYTGQRLEATLVWPSNTDYYEDVTHNDTQDD